MIWRIKWSKAAKHHLLNISRADAEFIDAAVQRFARTPEGELGRFDTDTNRLGIGDYSVVLGLDPEGDAVEDEYEAGGEDSGGVPTLWVMRLIRRNKHG